MKEKPKIKRSYKIIPKLKVDPTILEVAEKDEKEKRRVVGYQHYNPKTKGFVFIFSPAYPVRLRKHKKEELVSLAEMLDVPIEVRENDNAK